MRGSSSIVAALAALLAVTLLAFRAPDAFLTPQFWAEDGSLLWLDAYRDGVHAIFKPYAGYLMLAQRLIAQIASWFNPAAAPSIYLYAAVLLTAWSAATVAAVVPNSWMGLCFAVALLLPPMPAGEILANTTNIQWILAPTLVILLLTPPPRNRFARISNALFAIVAGLSGPFSILAMPIAIWRLRYYRDIFLTLVILAAIIQIAVLAMFPPIDATIRATDASHLVFTIIVRAFGGNIAAVPFGLVLLAASVLVRMDRGLRLGLIAFSGVIMITVFLKFMTSPANILESPMNGPRYFYIPHVTLLWCAISLIFSGRIGMIVGSICIVFMAFLVPKYFIRAAREDLRWPEYADRIGKQEVMIPIHPKGFWVHVILP